LASFCVQCAAEFVSFLFSAWRKVQQSKTFGFSVEMNTIGFDNPLDAATVAANAAAAHIAAAQGGQCGEVA